MSPDNYFEKLYRLSEFEEANFCQHIIYFSIHHS